MDTLGVGSCRDKGSGRHNYNGQDSEGDEGLKRTWNDFEASMKAMKDAVVKENREKSAKIRRLTEENIRLEETVLSLENLPFRGSGPMRPIMARPDPFVVFPLEVWEFIIERMFRSSDLEMLCLAFPQLEPLVKKMKNNIFLFEKVFPLISKHLHWKDILNCRLVCGQWNQDLCAILAKSLTTKPFLPWSGLSCNVTSGYGFDTHTKIETFLEQMSDYPGNPLFGKFLRFSVYSQTDLNYFWTCALKLVGKFGEHVWSFEVDFESFFQESYNIIEFYKEVHRLLNYLPNLKDLTVKYFTHDGRGQGENTMNLTALIGSCPLSPLPYLQSLKLALPSDTEMTIAFTRYFSSQIHRLELVCETLANVNLKAESLRGLINLEYLEVELGSKQDVLRLLKFPTANLKKMCLNTVSYPTPPISFSSEQFGCLLEKSSRLEHLDLTRCQGDFRFSSVGSDIRLSRLKTLKIEVGIGEDERQHNLDFLLWFSSLKHLVIKILYMGRTGISFEDYDRHSMLKIRAYILHYDEIFDSNIWTLMPSLEVLELRDREPLGFGHRRVTGNGIFTREMFENRLG